MGCAELIAFGREIALDGAAEGSDRQLELAIETIESASTRAIAARNW